MSEMEIKVFYSNKKLPLMGLNLMITGSNDYPTMQAWHVSDPSVVMFY